MIKISKMADYAVVLLTPLARSEGELMTAAGLSVYTGLPEPSVAKILKILTREGLLISGRGVNGGYRLSDKPEAITISRVISAIDGPIALTACVDGRTGTCGLESRCAVKGRWNGVNRVIREALEGITLADMVDQCDHRASGDLKVPIYATNALGGSGA